MFKKFLIVLTISPLVLCQNQNELDFYYDCSTSQDCQSESYFEFLESNFDEDYSSIF